MYTLVRFSKLMFCDETINPVSKVTLTIYMRVFDVHK